MKNTRKIYLIGISIIVIAIAAAVFGLPRLMGEVVVEINQPAQDNVVIENIRDSLFEVMAWDTRYGTENGAGIREVYIELYALPDDPRQNPDAAPVFVQLEQMVAYCLFGGVTCLPMGEAENSVIFPDGDYLLRARAVSHRGDTNEWVYRQFTLAAGATPESE